MPLLPFIFASLTPAALLSLGALLGGAWVWAGLLSMTVVIYVADRWKVKQPPTDRSGAALSVAVGLVHFALLALGVWALASGMALAEWLVLFFGLGLWFGQVSNSNAHELIHRQSRRLRRLGVAVYCSLLFGHHASAHPLVHHVHVATERDPNSAPRGMSYWRFVPHAWVGSFRAGFRLERQRNRGFAHPYLGYGIGSALTLGAAWLLAGGGGVLSLLGLASYAQAQLILSDYVQHYGLRRRVLPTGKPEPVGPEHSWNAPHWASSALMLNAPRHSDHHMHPGRDFPALELDARMPVLPFSLPVMGAVAMIPPLWRRIMDPRLARWTAG